LTLLTLCAGCARPAQRANYEAARLAVRNNSDVPAEARLPGMRGVELHIQKNAAQIVVPVEMPDGSRRSYTVWTRRVARTWVAERCFLTPAYEKEAATASGGE